MFKFDFKKNNNKEKTFCNYNLVSEATYISLQLNKGHLKSLTTDMFYKLKTLYIFKQNKTKQWLYKMYGIQSFSEL